MQERTWIPATVMVIVIACFAGFVLLIVPSFTVISSDVAIPAVGTRILASPTTVTSGQNEDIQIMIPSGLIGGKKTLKFEWYPLAGSSSESGSQTSEVADFGERGVVTVNVDPGEYRLKVFADGQFIGECRFACTPASTAGSDKEEVFFIVEHGALVTSPNGGFIVPVFVSRKNQQTGVPDKTSKGMAVKLIDGRTNDAVDIVSIPADQSRSNEIHALLRADTNYLLKAECISEKKFETVPLRVNWDLVETPPELAFAKSRESAFGTAKTGQTVLIYFRHGTSLFVPTSAVNVLVDGPADVLIDPRVVEIGKSGIAQCQVTTLNGGTFNLGLLDLHYGTRKELPLTFQSVWYLSVVAVMAGIAARLGFFFWRNQKKLHDLFPRKRDFFIWLAIESVVSGLTAYFAFLVYISGLWTVVPLNEMLAPLIGPALVGAVSGVIGTEALLNGVFHINVAS